MSTSLIRRAVVLFRSPYVPASTNRHNRVQWLRAVEHLGDRWIMRGGPAKWSYRAGDERGRA